MEDEIAKLAEASTLASIVGNTTVDEAASNVTAIMNVYGVEIDRIVEDVIDKINEIDLNSGFISVTVYRNSPKQGNSQYETILC